ncbi:MAG: hypothetical protein ACREDR_15540, partial [Blastocatellia bacterium]
ISGVRYLAIKSEAGHGSGFSTSSKTLYLPAANGLNEVLDFTCEGYLSGYAEKDCPTRQFSGRIVGSTILGDKAIVTILLEIEYSIDGVTLFRKRQTAVYSNGPKSDEFKFDPELSSVTQEEIEMVYDGDSTLKKDDFVRLYRKELEKIASIGSGSRRDWLKNYLPDFEPLR